MAHRAPPATSDARLSGGGFSADLILFDQFFDPRADLGAFRYPTFNRLYVNTQTLFLTACNRVKEPKSIDKTPVTRLATIRYRNVKERPLFRATSG
jgi:hypothetical protein